MNSYIEIDTVISVMVVALLVFSASTILHELSHWLACKILNCRVVGMKLLFLYFDGKKWSLRLKGKSHCAFVSDDKSKVKKVAVAGPLIEIVAVACCISAAFSARQEWLKYGLASGAIMIAGSVIYDLLPVTNGDGRMLFGKGKR